MSALYPLRMNSKYLSKIDQLEGMGFDANQAAQYLEEHHGNVLQVIDQLLQDTADEESEYESDDEQDYGEENEQSEGEPYDAYDPMDPHSNPCLSISIEGFLNSLHDLYEDIKFMWNGFISLVFTPMNIKIARETFIVFVCILAVAYYQLMCCHLENDIAANFTTVYDFEDSILFADDDVIIKHMYHYDAYLHSTYDMAVSKPLVQSYWRLLRVQNEDGGRNLVKLMNDKSGKYLRINKKGEVDVNGNGGRFTLFEVTVVEANSHNFKGVRLESVQYPGKYVVMRANGEVMVTDDCDGDIDCVLIFLTTERSAELKSKKYELKIAELQQEIQYLKAKAVDCGDRAPWEDREEDFYYL